MPPHTLSRSFVATLLSTAALALPGFAQTNAPLSDEDNPDVQDTVIVTGQYLANEKFSGTKTQTPLVDVPQSLSVVSAAQIADQFFVDIGDISRFTPGVSIGLGEGHRDQITIRGQNTTADFFVDGLRDDVQYFRPLYNLEQVEILRGSNALIFGRGGGGGVINRVTKKGVIGETFGSATASVDTFGSALIAGDINIEAGDKAAFRLNGFYENLENHRDFFGGDRFAFNPTGTFELTPDTRLQVSYEYVDDDRVVDRGVPSLNGEPLRDFDTTFFGDPDFNRTTLQAHIARARLDHNFTENISSNITVQFADYDKLYQNLFPIGFDDVAGSVSLDGYIDETERQNIIIQGNVVADFETGFLGHTLLVGAEYGDQDTANSRRDTFFADSQDDQITFLFTDPLIIPQVAFPTFNRDRGSDVQFVSVYAQDQIDIGEHLKLIAGVRYDRFEVDVLNADASVLASNGGVGLPLERNDTEFSPRIGLIYKPQDNISLYGSWSQSFLPRSGDQFLVLIPATESLAPEAFENFEIGAKWDITNRLFLTAALFQLDRDAGTTSDPDNVDNLIIIGSRTQGLELQLSGELLPNWSINAGYSYLDADERGRVVNGVVDNRTLSQVPEHLFSLWNRYDVTSKFGLGVGVTFQSDQFASISNTVELPDFARLDAAIYYQLNDRIQLQVNLENITNPDFFPSAHNDNNIQTAEPFNARFTLTTNF